MLPRFRFPVNEPASYCIAILYYYTEEKLFLVKKAKEKNEDLLDKSTYYLLPNYEF